MYLIDACCFLFCVYLYLCVCVVCVYDSFSFSLRYHNQMNIKYHYYYFFYWNWCHNPLHSFFYLYECVWISNLMIYIIHLMTISDPIFFYFLSLSLSDCNRWFPSNDNNHIAKSIIIDIVIVLMMMMLIFPH